MPEALYRGLILAKVETTKGTDAAPSGTDAIRTLDAPQFTPEMDIADAGKIAPTGTAYPGVVAGQRATVEFSVPLKGSGSAGTAPEIGVLLQACGLGENIVAGTSVDYTPEEAVDSQKTVTIYVYRSGRYYKLLGAAGTFSLDITNGDIAKITFRFQGVYGGIATGSLPTPTFDSTAPLPVAGATLAGDLTSEKLNALSFDWNASLAMVPDPSASAGYAYAAVTGREPNGEVTVLTTASGTAFETDYAAGTTQNLDVTLGSSAGNIVQVQIPYAQITGLNDNGDVNGLRAYTLQYRAAGSAGSDEFKIIFT